jgi:hypothetical protein
LPHPRSSGRTEHMRPRRGCGSGTLSVLTALASTQMLVEPELDVAACTTLGHSGTDGRAFVKGIAGGARVKSLSCAAATPDASMRTSAIGGLPALGRAESRPAPRCIRGLHEQSATPAAVTEVVGPLSPSQVPVVGTIFHGGRYRNTRIRHSSGHHPVSGKPGKRSAGVTRRRERSERGHEVALTAVRSDRHSPAWGGGHGEVR